MYRQIYSTYKVNISIAAINFFVVWLSIKYLGAGGRGEISLMLLNISITQIVCSVIGNGPMVYLYNKEPLSNLLFLSTCWAVLCSIVVTLLLAYFSAINGDYILWMIFASIIMALQQNFLSVLAASNKIKSYNIIRLACSVIVMLSVLVWWVVLAKTTAISYLYLMTCSNLTTLSACIFIIFKEINLNPISNINASITQYFRFGVLNQFNNLIQLGNYRYTLYIINSQLGLTSTGIFSLALTLVDSIWLFKGSIVVSHLTEVAQYRDDISAKKNVNNLVFLSGTGTLLLVISSLIIPTSFYIFVFGSDFSEIKRLLALMSPGIILFACGVIYSHYFSGRGLLFFNTLSSALGFLVVVIFGRIFIAKYNIEGAAIINSLSYCVTALCLAVFYYFFSRVGKWKRSHL